MGEIIISQNTRTVRTYSLGSSLGRVRTPWLLLDWLVCGSETPNRSFQGRAAKCRRKSVIKGLIVCHAHYNMRMRVNFADREISNEREGKKEAIGGFERDKKTPVSPQCYSTPQELLSSDQIARGSLQRKPRSQRANDGLALRGSQRYRCQHNSESRAETSLSRSLPLCP